MTTQPTHASRIEQCESDIHSMIAKENLEDKLTTMMTTLLKQLNQNQLHLRREIHTSKLQSLTLQGEIPRNKSSVHQTPILKYNVFDVEEGMGNFRNHQGIEGKARQNKGSNWRNRRLDFPIFTGESPDGWILRAVRYFGFYSLMR